MRKTILIVACSFMIIFILVMVALEAAHIATGLQLEQLIGESMEPTFKSDSLVTMVKADPAQIRVGDIIGFYVPSFDLRVCHRVIEIVQTDQGEGFITKGDGNSEPDIWVVYPKDLEGKVGFDVSWLLPAVQFSRSPLGLGVMEIIPLSGLMFFAVKKH
jgi:signal peptidase I